MINVIASITIKPGEKEAFLKAFRANLTAVRAENGCIEYFPAVDVDASLPPQILDDNVITILEKWDSLDALSAHLTAPHMLAYREKVKGIVESTTLKVLADAS